MRLRAMVCALSFALSACAMSKVNQDSPTYQAGYADGCATANAEASSAPMPAKRDAMLFASDTEYRSGWAAGHGDCRLMNGPPRL